MTLEQLDTCYESLQLYIYTTCICSMSKVGRVSNHRVSKLRISADEQHRCMGLNSHGVSKVSVIDAAGVKQVEHK